MSELTNTAVATVCDIDLEVGRGRSRSTAEDRAADRITAAVVGTYRALLRAETPIDISDSMIALVGGIGGSAEPPTASGRGQLPINLSFGARPPLVPAGDAETLALLSAILPGLIADALVAFDRVVRNGFPLTAATGVGPHPRAESCSSV